MPALSTGAIGDLLEPYFPAAAEPLLLQLSTYLDLLLRWNARTNLTAIREPAEVVRRHFGESLLASLHVPASAETLLDYGSGAGFPGVPIQLARPDLRVTLAESQNKKAAFLREVVRVLGLGTVVWPSRVETLPGPARFDVVALRAVDDPSLALEQAWVRLAPGGTLLHLASGSPPPGAEPFEEFPLPGTSTVLRVSHPV